MLRRSHRASQKTLRVPSDVWYETLAVTPFEFAYESDAAGDGSDSLARGAFVGRERELAELVAGVRSAAQGYGRLFLIVGEPGIGKSRLADEVSVDARSMGALVLRARCWEGGGAPAYWPWVQVLRRCCDDAGDALRARLGATDPVERASFNPFFTFFLGGVTVFEAGTRVGAVGVSGLPGDTDEQLAIEAIERLA